MDLPSGVGLSREIKADGNAGRSLTSLSCSILANELYVAAKESLLGHFKEVIIEEITKLICPRCDGSICQEPADVPDSIGTQGPPCSAEPMDRAPPYFSQMAADEAPIPAAMKNNSPYLALVWQTESRVTMIKLADDPSKQMEDFLSDSHTSGRFSSCYIAPVKSIQEANKSEILEDLNVNFDFNNQQRLERSSSSDAPRESRPYHMKRKPLIDQASPTNVGAFPTSPLKKRRHGNESSQGLNGPNHLKRKRPVNQASPSNAGSSPMSPLKKKRRRNVPSQKVVTTVKAPCDAANLKSQQELKLVSSSDALHTEKEKRPRYFRKKEKLPIPCRSNGSARTSING